MRAFFLWLAVLPVGTWGADGPVCDVSVYSGTNMEANVEDGDARNSAIFLQVECFDVKGSTVTPLPLFIPMCANGLAWDAKLRGCTRCPRNADEVQEFLGEGETFNYCQSTPGGCMCMKSVEKTEEFSYTDQHGTSQTQSWSYQVMRMFKAPPKLECSDLRDPNCASLNPYMYAWNVQSMSSLVTPLWRCNETLQFNRLPAGMMRIYSLPPVAKNSIFEMFKVMESYGFEDVNSLVSKWELKPNKVTFMVVSELAKQGSVIKVGPNIDEFKQFCSVKLNLFTNPDGEADIGRDAFLNASNIPVRYPPCSVDGIKEAMTEWEGVVSDLKAVSQTEVQCKSPGEDSGSTGAKRRLKEKTASHIVHEAFKSWEESIAREGGVEDGFPFAKNMRRAMIYPQMLQAQQANQRRLQQQLTRETVYVNQRTQRREGELYDGMDCEEKRHVINKKLETGMSRAFMYSMKDAFIGCSGLLNKWSVYEEIDVTETTNRCAEPMTNELGAINKAWAQDPCCNWAKRVEQCCAPRTFVSKLRVISGVNEEKIAEYAAVVGPETAETAVSIALQYATLERDAALKCFQPLRDFWNAVSDTWELVDTCRRAIQGSWNSQYNQMLGDSCTNDVDCWTMQCSEVKSSSKSSGGGGGGSGGAAKKFCKTPAQTASKDNVSPMIKCLVDSSPPSVGKFFLFTMERAAKNSGLIRKGDEDQMKYVCRYLLNKAEWLESYCDGYSNGAWYAKTKEECEKDIMCNWAEPWVRMEDSECLNPCGGKPCPKFCGEEGVLGQANTPAMCVATVDFWKHASKCYQYPQGEMDEFEKTCQECKNGCTSGQEDCLNGCRDCKVGCSNETSWVDMCRDCTGDCSDVNVSDVCKSCLHDVMVRMPDLPLSMAVYVCRASWDGGALMQQGGDDGYGGDYTGGGSYTGGSDYNYTGGSYSGGYNYTGNYNDAFSGGYAGDGTTSSSGDLSGIGRRLGTSRSARVLHARRVLSSLPKSVLRRLQEIMRDEPGREACTWEEEPQVLECAVGCGSCESECAYLGAGAHCSQIGCFKSVDSCTETCMEKCQTVNEEGQTCEACAFEKCVESRCQGGIDSAPCLQCLRTECGCTRECTDCHINCTVEEHTCFKDLPLFEYKPSPRDRCLHNCEESSCQCETWKCQDRCQKEQNECNWEWQDLQRQKWETHCYDTACRNATGGNESVKFDRKSWQCIFESMSFADSERDNCMAECFGADGPRPVAENVCMAELNPATAKEDSCYNLGSGWIDTIYEDNIWSHWDWSRGPPPPKYCHIRSYMALDGKPWVPPPPYGQSCLETCEAEMDSCLWNDECNTWLEDQGTSVWDACRIRFDEFRNNFSDCEQTFECTGAACVAAKAECRKQVGLEADPVFQELKCARCSGEWMTWDMKTVQCAKELTVPACRWEGGYDKSQPCAQSCLWDLCHGEFLACQGSGKSTLYCAENVKNLNQCRECDFAPCMDSCKKPCNTFGWWEEPVWNCAGCHESDGNQCFEGASCYGNMTCDPWNQIPTYGPKCDFSCTRQIDACKQSLQKHCWNYDPDTGIMHSDYCHETFDLQYGSDHSTCVQDKIAEKGEAGVTSAEYTEIDILCRKQVAPAEFYDECVACFWGSWEFLHGPACIDGTITFGGNYTVNASCATECTLNTMRRLADGSQHPPKEQRRMHDGQRQLQELEEKNGRARMEVRNIKVASKKDFETKAEALRKLEALQSDLRAAKRRLKGVPEEAQLSCTDSNCSAQQTLCKNFFVREGEAQARLNASLRSHQWGEAPWLDKTNICQDVSYWSTICYASMEDTMASFDNISWSPAWGCDMFDSNNTACDGCVNHTAPCEYDCRCLGGSLGAHAVLHNEGKMRVCGALADYIQNTLNSEGYKYGWAEFDGRLLDGVGGCKYSLDMNAFMPPGCNLPCYDENFNHIPCDGCHPPPVTDALCGVQGFRSFRLTRKFEPGKLDTKETCEAETCQPMSWAANKDECEAQSYCEGDCPYCEDANMWDWEQAKTRVLCQFIGQAGEALSESDCKKACGNSTDGSCRYVKNNRTGTGICLTPRSPDDKSDHGCREITKPEPLAGAVVTNIKWAPLKCSSFSRTDCNWAKDAFDVLDCGIQRLQCKNKIDCQNSGRCEYRTDEWTVEQEGGLCVHPHAPLTFDPDMGLIDDRWSKCDGLKNALGVARSEYTPFGCILFKDEFDYYGSGTSSKKPAEKKAECEGSMHGKWFPYAYSPAECEVPGYAWRRNGEGKFEGSGTHLCCIRWWGGGESAECEMFSTQDRTQAQCDACGGQWMPMFKYRIWGRWIQGTWGTGLTWQNRSLSPTNKWISRVPEWKIAMLWENVVNTVKTRPMSNFIECRMSPTFSTLVGIASKEIPQPKLGVAKLLPQQAESEDFGAVGIQTTEKSYLGEEENDVIITTDSVFSNLAGSNGTRRNDTQGNVTQGNMSGGRRLEDKGTLKAMTAACFSVLEFAGKTVGQLVGDCVGFEPKVAFDSSVELCLSTNPSVPRNTDFDTENMVIKEQKDGKTVYTIMSTTAYTKEAGAFICTQVKNKGTYCPAKRYKDYTSASVVSADNECSTVADLSTRIVTKSTKLVAEGFKGTGDFLAAGETEKETTIEEKASQATWLSTEAAVATGGTSGGGDVTTTTTTTKGIVADSVLPRYSYSAFVAFVAFAAYLAC